MKFSEFNQMAKNAEACETLEKYRICECPPPFMHENVKNFEKVLGIVFSAAHGDFKGVISGYRLTEISEDFGIPYRSVQNWIGGQNSPPAYLVKLIAFAIVCQIADE